MKPLPGILSTGTNCLSIYCSTAAIQQQRHLGIPVLQDSGGLRNQRLEAFSVNSNVKSIVGLFQLFLIQCKTIYGS